MNVHVPQEIIDKYPTYNFEGKSFSLSNGKHYIRALHIPFNKTHFYCFEEDFFYFDKEDFMPQR